jgi:hypothetical protein
MWTCYIFQQDELDTRYVNGIHFKLCYRPLGFELVSPIR